MDPALTPAAPAAHPAPRSKGWLATHQTQAALGAGGAVLAFALYKRSRAISGAPAGLGTTTPAGTVSGAYPYSSSQLDQYNQLAGAISNLNDEISAIKASSASSAAASTPPSPSATLPGTGGLSSPGVPLVSVAPFTSPIPAAPVPDPGSQGYNVQTGNLQSYSLTGAGTTAGGLIVGPASAFGPPPNGSWGGTPYVLEGGQLVTRDASGI